MKTNMDMNQPHGEAMVQGFRSPSVARIAGNVATAAFLLAICLQLLLALGVLPVTLAWGGTQSVLTTPLRLANVAAVRDASGKCED